MKKDSKKISVPKLTRSRLQTVLMGALGVAVLFQMVQLYQVRDNLAFIDDLQERNSDVLQELSQGKDYLVSFGQDLNEIREFLLLPTHDYNFGDLGDVELSSDPEEEDVGAQVFTYVQKLGEYEQNREEYAANLALIQNDLKQAYWTEKGLQVDPAGISSTDGVRFSFIDPSLNNTELFSVSLEYNGEFTADSISGPWDFELEELHIIVDNSLGDWRTQLQTLSQSRSFLSTVVASQPVKDALSTHSLTVTTELSSPDSYYYDVHNSDLSTVLTLSISKADGLIRFEIAEPKDDYKEEYTVEAAELESQLVDVLSNGIDARTEVQKLVLDRQASIESVFDDRAYKAVISELKLKMGEKTETADRISYPVLREDGEVLRIIYIEKSTAEVKVENPGGESTTLSMAIELLDPSGKKKLWTPAYS